MANSLIYNKAFRFSDSYNTKTTSSLCVQIQEAVDAEFGSYLWPSSVVLAQYLWYKREQLSNKSFLELGAGTALPSIVALMCTQPKHVIITDKLCSSRESLHLNGIKDYADHYVYNEKNLLKILDKQVHLLPLEWNEVSFECIQLFSHCLPDVILGSDIFYDPSLFEIIISTVYFLLKTYAETNKNLKSAKFYCTYQTRSLDWSIADLLHEWGLVCCTIPLEHFEANKYDIAESGMPGSHTIQMMELSLE